MPSRLGTLNDNYRVLISFAYPELQRLGFSGHFLEPTARELPRTAIFLQAWTLGHLLQKSLGLLLKRQIPSPFADTPNQRLWRRGVALSTLTSSEELLTHTLNFENSGWGQRPSRLVPGAGLADSYPFIPVLPPNF